MKEKHHMIQFQGAISEAGQGVVHHLEVFHCQVPADVDIPYYDAPCSSNSERPRGLESCSRVIGAWAMGANPLSYPAEAGVPIGGPNYSRYVMIEVHYNNPEHRTGIVDNSGIKFHYTRTLRRYDAGIMELGLEYIDKMALPPGQALWKLNGYCIPECTSVSLPADGIKIFASQLHTHLTGLRAYTKHYRNGVELPELNRDNHYSPHYQEIRKLPRPVTVLPGDALITTCEDQTVDRKEITLGGFSISDEMCVNYVHYYPLVDLEVCKSSVTTDSLYEFFRFMNKYQGEPTSKDYGISDNYKSIRWTPMNVHLLETFYDVAPLSMQCNQSDGRKFPGEWENTHIPKILFPMPPEERLCLQ
jgi:dopamine beta-monooxygenase